MEKQFQSWIPRPPSAKIAARLFGASPVQPARLRHVHLWSWLTPAAACALTLMVAVTGSNRRVAEFDERNNPAAIVLATVMSNGPRTFLLSKMDLNVEWNVWPRLGPWEPMRESGPVLRDSRLTSPLTNR